MSVCHTGHIWHIRLCIEYWHASCWWRCIYISLSHGRRQSLQAHADNITKPRCDFWCRWHHITCIDYPRRPPRYLRWQISRGSTLCVRVCHRRRCHLVSLCPSLSCDDHGSDRCNQRSDYQRRPGRARWAHGDRACSRPRLIYRRLHRPQQLSLIPLQLSSFSPTMHDPGSRGPGSVHWQFGSISARSGLYRVHTGDTSRFFHSPSSRFQEEAFLRMVVGPDRLCGGRDRSTDYRLVLVPVGWCPGILGWQLPLGSAVLGCNMNDIMRHLVSRLTPDDL